MGLAVGGGNNAFYILIVVIRRHVVGMAVYCVSQAVVADIHHHEKVFSADGFAEQPLCLTCAKARALASDEIVVQLIAGKEGRAYRRAEGLLTESHDVVVYFMS